MSVALTLIFMTLCACASLSLSSPLRNLTQLNVRAKYATGETVRMLHLAATVDELANSAKVMVSDTLNGRTETKIYDLSTSSVYSIRGADCKVTELADNTDPYFPFKLDDIATGNFIDGLFRLVNAVKSEKAEEYKRTVKIVSSSGSVDCHLTTVFTERGTKTYYCKSPLAECEPIPLETKIVCPHPGDNIIIQYSDFTTLVQQDLFQQPKLVYCDGAKSTNIEEPKLPPQATLTVEPSIRKVWYDGENSVYREDSREGLDVAPPKPFWITRIFDFNTGVIYKIQQVDGSCERTSMDSIYDRKLPSLYQLLFNMDSSEYIFQRAGQAPCLSQTCDVLAGKKLFKDGGSEIVNLYYIPDFNFSDMSGQQVKAAKPVYLEGTLKTAGEEDGSKRVNIHDYQVDIEDWSVFDISICKKSEERYRLRFEISVDHKVNYSLTGLKKEFLKTLKAVSKSGQPLRVNQIKVASKNDQINITVILYNSESSGISEISTEKFINNVRIAVMNNAFILVHNAYPGKNQVYKVKRFAALKTRNPETVNSGFTSGDMAGMGIGMLLLGLIVGIAGFAFFLRNRPNSRPVRLITS